MSVIAGVGTFSQRRGEESGAVDTVFFYTIDNKEISARTGAQVMN
jgi:hypothetical protein